MRSDNPGRVPPGAAQLRTLGRTKMTVPFPDTDHRDPPFVRPKDAQAEAGSTSNKGPPGGGYSDRPTAARASRRLLKPTVREMRLSRNQRTLAHRSSMGTPDEDPCPTRLLMMTT